MQVTFTSFQLHQSNISMRRDTTMQRSNRRNELPLVKIFTYLETFKANWNPYFADEKKENATTHSFSFFQ